MTVQELQKLIKQGDIPKVLLFHGEESGVRDVYISKIVDACGGNKYVFESSQSAFLKMTRKSLVKGKGVIVLYNDIPLTKEPKQWAALFHAAKTSQYHLIVVYDTLDKRSKFYKQNKDDLIEFTKLSPSVLSRYVSKFLPGIDLSITGRIAEVCECSYNRLVLECDKIKQYAQALHTGTTESFNVLMKQGVIYQPIGDITFDFVDAILLRNVTKAFQYAVQAKEVGESELLTLSVLYEGLKNILLIQGLPPNTKDLANQTGLNPYQVMQAKRKAGHYSNEELIRAMKLVREVERGIKLGLEDPNIAVEYVIMNII